METKDKKKSKWKITAGVILIIQLLLSMATVGVVLWLNIVPTLYVILLGLILLLLLIIEYCLFYFSKKKKGKKKTGCYVRRAIGVILSLACMVVCAGGSYMLVKAANTLDNIAGNVKTTDTVSAYVMTDDPENSYQKAEAKLKEMADLIRNGKQKEFPSLKLKSSIEPQFPKAKYCEMVEKAKHYIHEGDIFQVVLSNRLEADYEGSLLDTYRVLRTTNPSPYMFYFSGEDIEVAGASPETLVKLEDGVLHTFPLAGTRPRGKTPAQDEALERELLADEKECAEHNMLVDLGRNDIGRISRFGSVSVEKYMEIERYSHVMHIGSTVRGEIKPACDAVDAVDAILPAGTLSGAPKIRACEIIAELENNKRGIYGGAIGYIDFTGNLDTCIAIRIAYKKNGKVFVRSGAGIVADSVPEKEYEECLNKAAAVTEALKTASGGIDL